MAEPFNETTYFQYARRIDGRLEAIDTTRHNGRLVPRFDPSWTDSISDLSEDDSELEELIAELSYNLNPLERRTWLQLIDGLPVEQIADAEGVSRTAVYERIRGNFKKQGGMVKKNDYVRIWWNLRQSQK
jgi:DNA-directed RNA polymerase specialized sigma24 family protein